ncbi:flagellar hook-basal body complex protein FliE [Aequitasia blattaphilus]|uniref:Flagellar hook-basal body complex protein FliE n=1 Tax=Aequitasia blattaphilus TaxID=2949332 RepID=A0ABT1EDF4_9FIRM|nr:flagellar hook-basal body complex protein FliE [Aequitasia blattaphilus]MCP1102502.1 flagellar hook-basal body complex protein FliE [Aequitasia blattaphilus]MCR8615142.1 flagellar hook-basal body complex protein FliE [Aequitasia blattaphilus]
MENNFISPIKPANSLNELHRLSKTNSSEGTFFKGIFEDAVSTVKDSENNLANQQYLLATGQIDDAHTVQVAASEAQLAVDMLVQLRNKALESYNELMRTSL